MGTRLTADLRCPKAGPARLLADLVRAALSPDAIPACCRLVLELDDPPRTPTRANRMRKCREQAASG
jgi:hypothetical protein